MSGLSRFDEQCERFKSLAPEVASEVRAAYDLGRKDFAPGREYFVRCADLLCALIDARVQTLSVYADEYEEAMRAEALMENLK